MLVLGSEAGAATKRRTRVPTGPPPAQLLPGDRAPWALGALEQASQQGLARGGRPGSACASHVHGSSASAWAALVGEKVEERGRQRA